MDPISLWQAFIETGAPEFYLMYNQARKAELNHVSDGSGTGHQSNQIQ